MKLHVSWHQPDLYFVLFLLAGLATFLAIIYECIQRFRGRKPPVDGLFRERPPRHHLPAPNPVRPDPGPEERLRDLQRAAFHAGQPRKGLPPNPWRKRPHPNPWGVPNPWGEEPRNRPNRRLTPGEIQRLEQDSRTRL